MAIYLDAIWFLNFLLDFMLLLLTDKLAKLNTRNSRIVFGAFIASLIVPLTVYYPSSPFTSLAGKFLFSIVIIVSAFGFKNIRRMGKLLLLFYFMSFSIGGALVALHFVMQNPIAVSNAGILTHNTGYGDPVSWMFVAFGFPVCWLFTKGRMDKHVQDKIRYDAIYPVAIQIKNKVKTTKGYIDSGNQLVDPITKKPVVLCDEAFLKEWFEEDDWEDLKHAYQSFEIEKIPEKWMDSIQVIPYHGVEGSNGLLLAVKPDLLVIDYHHEQIKTTEFLIGIQFGSLTKDGSYHCLLQPELILSAAVYSA